MTTTMELHLSQWSHTFHKGATPFMMEPHPSQSQPTKLKRLWLIAVNSFTNQERAWLHQTRIFSFLVLLKIATTWTHTPSKWAHQKNHKNSRNHRGQTFHSFTCTAAQNEAYPWVLSSTIYRARDLSGGRGEIRVGGVVPPQEAMFPPSLNYIFFKHGISIVAINCPQVPPPPNNENNKKMTSPDKTVCVLALLKIDAATVGDLGTMTSHLAPSQDPTAVYSRERSFKT